MTLDSYRRKRDFRQTPEPRGSKGKAQRKLSYVIQRHQASHLHYDFRLELDGVLKSWAIPKGPSLDPAQKRLAVQVEDHPLEYRSFEGEIPPHQYGAGTVVIWDQGNWIPEDDPHEAYRRGHLKFRLEGVKLSGGWSLVRMQSSKAGKENWLLIKEHDAHAATGSAADITSARPESAAAQAPRTPAKTAHAKAAAGSSARKAATAAKAIAAGMPDSVQPQLATLAASAPEGDNWLSEVKFDGYRALCRIANGQAQLFTRAGHDWSAKWPALIEAAAALPVREAWLDGEVVAIGADGTVNFQLLQNFARDDNGVQLAYYLFDLMYLDGRDLRQMPLVERKQLLKSLLNGRANGPLLYSDHVSGNAPQAYSLACMHALEGIVVKRADAPYVSTRSRTWLKLKCLLRQEFVIGAHTDPAGAREKFGALLLGVHEPDGQLSYVGKVGTGFDQATLHALAEKFTQLRSRKSPFRDPPSGKGLGRIHWLRPALVAEVRFSQWTAGGAIRHASFVGLRSDKPAAEIVRERAASATEVRDLERTADEPADNKRPAKPRRRPAAHPGTDDDETTLEGVKLTHPSRLLFPDAGISKLDLAQYYKDVADWILPHLAGRPLTLVRCPEGQGRQCFFQRHGSHTVSAEVETVKVARSDGKASYMMANSAAALVGLVQLGVLELHTWGARQDSLDRPDRLIFDLDPAPGVPWKQVIEAAQRVRTLMDEIGLASFVKTTGGKGLHVVIPVRPEKPWDDIKTFARAVAERLERTYPQHFTAKMTKTKRAGKIFIDYLRNAAEATAVAAYSTRARAGAPVSTPIGWNELGPDLHSDSFTLTNIRARLKKLKRDPWAAYFSSNQHLTDKMLDILTSD